MKVGKPYDRRFRLGLLMPVRALCSYLTDADEVRAQDEELAPQLFEFAKAMAIGADLELTMALLERMSPPGM